MLPSLTLANVKTMRARNRPGPSPHDAYNQAHKTHHTAAYDLLKAARPPPADGGLYGS
jgi:hypothetical protein